MPRVFITGPRGLLGATLLRVLSTDDCIVTGFEGDIREPEDLRRAMADASPEVVVHTAAATDVSRCEREPEWCHGVNVDGTRNVRDVAAALGAKMINISTVSVFNGVAGNYLEDDSPEPHNVYNASKYQAETLALEYEHTLNLRLNIFGLHPDGSRGRNFMEWLVDSFRANRDMNLFTDIRINPLSNWTLAETIRDLILRPPDTRILHLGSSTVLSKADIGRKIAVKFPAYTGKVTYTSSDTLSATAFRPREMWLNVDRAVSLGYPMPTLESEVERIMSFI